MKAKMFDDGGDITASLELFKVKRVCRSKSE